MKIGKELLLLLALTALLMACESDGDDVDVDGDSDSSTETSTENDTSTDETSTDDTSADDTSNDTETSEYDFSAVATEVEAFISEKDEVEGVGAIIVQKDKGVIYKKAFGAFADDRDYLIASSSKVITAGIIMTLVDEGKLALETPGDP